MINIYRLSAKADLIRCDSHAPVDFVTKTATIGLQPCDLCELEEGKRVRDIITANCWIASLDCRYDRVYIGGPMTGLPQFNIPAFRRMERVLSIEKPGMVIFNPARNDQELFYAAQMKIDIGAVLNSSAVVFLKGWENSKGAVLEHNIASFINLKKYYEL